VNTESKGRHHAVRQHAKKNIAKVATKIKKRYDNSKILKAVNLRSGTG